MAVFKSRSKKRADNNLGIVQVTDDESKKYRTPALDKIDKYLNNKQYDTLMDWNEADRCKQCIPIRMRKPRIIYPFASVLTDRLSAKLLGKNVFPTLGIEEDEDTNELLKVIYKAVYFQSVTLNSIKKFVSHGATFIRFFIVDGSLKMDHYNPKYCYPEFDNVGGLDKVVIKYVFADPEDLDERGKPVEKWYKLELNKQADILFDTPIYKDNVEPDFTVVSRADHQLGFVQGEWLRTSENRHMPDGKSIVTDLYGFMDSMNYNLSQSDRAVSYGLDPQLTIAGMDETEVDSLIKSSAKGWHLGRDGQANFLEVSGSGAKMAEDTRTSLRKDIQDIARVIMLDPEKIMGSAQSGKAMEVLHAPMVELVNELRPQVEKGLISLSQKMLLTVVIYNQRGIPLLIQMPPQYRPQSIDIAAIWPEIFPKTMQDLRDKVGVGVQVAGANIISRENVLRWLAKDFDIEDIEAEVAKVNSQQQFGFGGFGGF